MGIVVFISVMFTITMAIVFLFSFIMDDVFGLWFEIVMKLAFVLLMVGGITTIILSLIWLFLSVMWGG